MAWPKYSYLDCPHKNVQDWTDYCFDCGYNINMTEEEYRDDLLKQAKKAKNSPLHDEIRDLERRLKGGQ